MAKEANEIARKAFRTIALPVETVVEQSESTWAARNDESHESWRQ